MWIYEQYGTYLGVMANSRKRKNDRILIEKIFYELIFQKQTRTIEIYSIVI